MSQESLETAFNAIGCKRYKCSKCGADFWSPVVRDTCGEYPCDDMVFKESQLLSREYSVAEMRETFLSFFEENGHERISRYPVVARWRDDVFLVNASIYDFQPHVTGGEVPPPANPLTISQPCIRLTDIHEVGKTNRHLTSFEMMAHHAFNYPDKEVYWKNETVALCHRFLTERLGIDEKYITYKEKPWFGGGNAGEAVEVIVGGIEVATLVFMDLVEDANGDTLIEGVRYRKMDMRVVDTGYGLERLVWLSKGGGDIYRAVYPEVMRWLLERMDNFRAASILADHSRTAVFMLNDGIVPSNAKAGYLARMIIRKMFRVLDETGWPVDVHEILDMQWERFSDFLDSSMKSIVHDVFSIELDKYRDTIKRGRGLVERLVRSGKVDLVKLYDSHGLPPEYVRDVARELGVNIDIPEDFHSLVAQLHSKVEVEKKKKKELPYETHPLYYDDQYMKEFDASVIAVDGEWLVLDRTAFYPEGGGQDCDLGIIEYGGKKYPVRDVQKFGNAIGHLVDGSIPVGSTVHGVIDWERRSRLMHHHTATHILAGAARNVLGNHVWQAGAHKSPGEARLDITHYRGISADEVRDIERRVNEVIRMQMPVDIFWLSRDEADKRYGFRLYQGGAPVSKEIRIVRIDGVDTEGCGGTHVKNTGELGVFKIKSVERLQDGVDRIVFVAGAAAVDYMLWMDDILREASSVFRVSPDKLPSVSERFFNEWKAMKKEVESLRKLEAPLIMAEVREHAREVSGFRLYVREVDNSRLGELAKVMSKELSEGYIVVLYSSNSQTNIAVVTSGKPSAGELVKCIARAAGGAGGGSPGLARGSIPSLNTDIYLLVDECITEKQHGGT